MLMYSRNVFHELPLQAASVLTTRLNPIGDVEASTMQGRSLRSR